MNRYTIFLISCISIQSCNTRFGTHAAVSQENPATPYNRLVHYVDSNATLGVDEVLDLYSKLSSSDLRRFLTEYPEPNEVIESAENLSVREMMRTFSAAGKKGKSARRQYNTARAKFLTALFGPFALELANLPIDREALRSLVAKKKTEILGPSTFDSEKLVLNFPANFVRLSAAHNPDFVGNNHKIQE